MFDPLAVMLVIAANQTLLRYGINLESSGPPTPPKEPEPEPEPEPEEEFVSGYDTMPDVEDLERTVNRELEKLEHEKDVVNVNVLPH